MSCRDGCARFITYQRSLPPRSASAYLWTSAYRCAETSKGARMCRRAPVTTPLACLQQQTVKTHKNRLFLAKYYKGQSQKDTTKIAKDGNNPPSLKS